MSNVIDSLFVGLGFQIDSSKLEEFKGKADELKSAALSFGTIFTTAAAGVGFFVQQVAAGMSDIHDFAELNEMSAKSVAALGKIASENDSSMDAMKSSIGGLNKVIGEAVLGVGRGAMTFEKLGLSAKDANGEVKQADIMLEEIASRMEGMSRQEQMAFAAKLGIDPSMVKLLAQGGDNLAKLREEAELMSPFTDKDYALADQIDKLFIKAKNSLGVFTKILAVQLMPVVRDVLKTYLEWFKGARKATSGEFSAAIGVFANAVQRAWEWTKKLTSALFDAGKWLVKTKVFAIAAAAALAIFASVKTYDALVLMVKGLRGITMAMAGFNATALIVPAIIGAIVLAVAALIDDWMVWKEGGDSVIGDLIEQFPMLEAVILAIEDAVRSVGAFFIGIFETLAPSVGDLAVALWNLATTIMSIVWPVIKMVFEGWAYILAGVLPIIAEIIAAITGGIVGAINSVIQAVTTLIDGATSLVKGFFDFVGSFKNGLTFGASGAGTTMYGGLDKTGGVIRKAAEASEATSAASPAGESGAAYSPAAKPGGVIGKAADMATNNSNSTATTNNNVQVTAPITINSTDPAKAGESVRQELNRVNRQTTRNGESAVAL